MRIRTATIDDDAWLRAARVAVAATLLLIASATQAAEWFVSTLGSDATGNGSPAAPFRTLTHVLAPSAAIARSRDTVTLLGPAGNNTFRECDVRLRVPLTLRSPAGEMARIHCDLTTTDSVAIQIDPEASGSRLSRLEISGGYYYGIFLQTDWDQRSNPGGTGASDIVIEDVKIHDTGRDGIKITPKCDHVTIRRSEIWNTGAIYPAGTSLDDKNAEGIDNVNGSFMTVEDSYIHHTATTGLYFKGGATDVIVQRNRIENTGAAGILVGFDTSPEFFDIVANPQYYEAIRGVVRNNIIRNTNYAGIGLYAARDSIVSNNTIINTANLGHAALYFGVTFQDYEPEARRPASINPLIRNNLILQTGGDCVRIRYSEELGGLSGLAGSANSDFNAFHDTAGACQFVDARPGSTLADGGTLEQWRAASGNELNSLLQPLVLETNARLPAGSPAIDRGQTIAQVSDDFEGHPRVGPYDIGADEFASSPSVGPPRGRPKPKRP